MEKNEKLNDLTRDDVVSHALKCILTSIINLTLTDKIFCQRKQEWFHKKWKKREGEKKD